MFIARKIACLLEGMGLRRDQCMCNESISHRREHRSEAGTTWALSFLQT